MKGEYVIHDIPIGTYDITASKEGYLSQTVKNIKVLEEQATGVNFQLGGEENMGTYTEPIVVMDGSLTTIHVPVEEPTVLKRFLDVDTPMVSKVVELLTEDNTTILQTQTTNAEGIVTFENILHGNYNVTIHY